MRRQHSGLLHRHEARLVVFLVRRIPQALAPDHLTLIGLAGASLAGASVVACHLSRWFLVPYCLGLTINWFGDSLDGALARHLHRERHKAGLLIDRCCDILSFVIMILALGLSPFLPFICSLMLVAAYLIHSAYGLMRTIVDDIQFVGLGGIGATEGRLFMALWAIVLSLLNIDLFSSRYAGVAIFELICGVLLAGMLGLFAGRVIADVRRVDAIENARSLSRAGQGEKVVSISLRRDLGAASGAVGDKAPQTP